MSLTPLYQQGTPLTPLAFRLNAVNAVMPGKTLKEFPAAVKIFMNIKLYMHPVKTSKNSQATCKII